MDCRLRFRRTSLRTAYRFIFIFALTTRMFITQHVS
jgi:hypothetical protein